MSIGGGTSARTPGSASVHFQRLPTRWSSTRPDLAREGPRRGGSITISNCGCRQSRALRDALAIQPPVHSILRRVSKARNKRACPSKAKSQSQRKLQERACPLTARGGRGIQRACPSTVWVFLPSAFFGLGTVEEPSSAWDLCGSPWLMACPRTLRKAEHASLSPKHRPPTDPGAFVRIGRTALAVAGWGQAPQISVR
jgi:hypothetical protein